MGVGEMQISQEAALALLGLCEQMLETMDHEDKLRWTGPLGEKMNVVSGRLYSETTLYKALRITVAKAKGEALGNDTKEKR
jgi:hypothetical protein